MKDYEVLDHVDMGPGCWEWECGHDGRGYSFVRIDGKPRKVHVVLYEEFYGPVPAGKELHHICENKGCVRPSHLQPVSRSEHLIITANLKGRATHCKRGHALDEVNAYAWKHAESRTCRQCNMLYTRKRRGVPLEAPARFAHECHACGLKWKSTTEQPKRCRKCGAHLHVSTTNAGRVRGQ